MRFVASSFLDSFRGESLQDQLVTDLSCAVGFV